MTRFRLLVYVFLIAMLPIILNAQNNDASQLEQQIIKLKAQIETQRQQQKEDFKKQLGERYQTLMNFSVSELQTALAFKVRENYEGATVMSGEDNPIFLGKIGDEFTIDSIFSTVGSYGGEVSSTSIWNPVGNYGGEISLYSPFNPISNKPPVIVMNNKIIGRLTVNTMFIDAVDPLLLKQYFKRR